MLPPVIKWTGSKRSQAEAIVDEFPKHIDTYYEPFLGGGSVLGELLQRDEISVGRYVCSDVNKDLISIWQTIKDNPHRLAEEYRRRWETMKSLPNIAEKRDFFNKERIVLNMGERGINPHAFFFVLRTCYNGMVRYNSKGEFNAPFHLTRDGIFPDKMENIIFLWHSLITAKDVQFVARSYEDMPQTNEQDFVYLDPPYAESGSLYFGGFEKDKFFAWLGRQNCNWALSYDGKVNNSEVKAEVPKELFKRHILLPSGNSSFSRLKGRKEQSVFESLYLSF